MTLPQVPTIAQSERPERPYWLRVCLFVVIMMTVTWLALWAASKGSEHHPATALFGTG